MDSKEGFDERNAFRWADPVVVQRVARDDGKKPFPEETIMKRTILLTILMALFLAVSANADTLVVNVAADQGSPGGSPIFDPPGILDLELPQFDPALGDLQSVDLTISTGHNGTFTHTSNVGDFNVRIDYIDWYYEVNAFGGENGNLVYQPWVNDPTDDDPFGMPPGHFNMPLTPCLEGETLGPVPFGNELTTYLTYGPGDSEFMSFIGEGTLPIQMIDRMVFQVQFFGQGSNSWQFETYFDIAVEAVYTYDSSVSTDNASWDSVKALYQ